MQVCPNCHEENPDRFRLCGYCGTSLTSHVARRTVTVVFCDLKGSTTLGHALDSESLWEVLDVYFHAMKAVVERHGGVIEKYIGDAIMAVFGLWNVHEDDALRAVRAAFEMRTALAEVNVQIEAGWGVRLENRTGVNTGEVVIGDPATGQRLVSGDTVNVAARLEQAAPATEVLIGEPTWRLVQHAVEVEAVEPLELKGKPERVPAYRLVGLRGSEAIPRRTDTPMVGRTSEFAQLRELFRRAVDEGTCQLATILGLPGIGKSRLVAELVRGVTPDEATVLEGRCLSYGDDTFWPLAEVVRQGAGIGAEDDVAGALQKIEAVLGPSQHDAAVRLASVTGLSTDVYPVGEVQWAARALLETIARRRPVLVVFDDIHWAEQTFLDLLEGLVESSVAAPLLVVCVSRPELLEDQPEWMAGQDRAIKIPLGELSTAESALVVRNLLGDTGLPGAVELRILEAADGNPLFVEQTIAMLVDDRLLVQREDGGWTYVGTSDSVEVPASITALLAARLDRLSPEERSVLERASVMGQVFYTSALAALADDGDVGSREALASLVRKNFVVPAQSDIDLAGEQASRFVHILVRDAAYRGLLKRARAHLHERFGDWLEGVTEASPSEYQELVGYHFEQAFHYRAELGQLGPHDIVLGGRGAAHLRAAGDRALARGDLPAAASILQRSANLLPPDDPARPRLLLEVSDALIELGEFAQAGTVLDEADEALAARFEDASLSAATHLAVLDLRYSTDPRAVEEEVVEETESMIAAFSDPEDHFVLTRAWRLLIAVHWMASMFGPAEEASEEAIRHAEADGDELRARRHLGGLLSCATYGPRPVPEAIARCEDILVRAAHDRKVTALAQCAIARLEAMRGNFERARDLYRRSRGNLEEFGWSRLAALTSIDSGPIEMLAGDFAAAERELRHDYEALQRMDEHNYISTIAALLASAVYEQGRFDEADVLAGTANDLGSPDDVTTQCLWRCVRAKVLAQRGAVDEARLLAGEAVAFIDRTDFLDEQGSARLDLAEVNRLVGDASGQETALDEAIERLDRKGNRVAAGIARAARGANMLHDTI